jgi:CO/xanthine dehydrogenase Mo-binding subunit
MHGYVRWYMSVGWYMSMCMDRCGMGGDMMDRCRNRVRVDGTSADVTASRTVASVVQLSDVGSSIVVPWSWWCMYRS